LTEVVLVKILNFSIYTIFCKFHLQYLNWMIKKLGSC
jgi:uncharacterized membrane protein